MDGGEKKHKRTQANRQREPSAPSGRARFRPHQQNTTFRSCRLKHGHRCDSNHSVPPGKAEYEGRRNVPHVDDLISMFLPPYRLDCLPKQPMKFMYIKGRRRHNLQLTHSFDVLSLSRKCFKNVSLKKNAGSSALYRFKRTDAQFFDRNFKKLRNTENESGGRVRHAKDSCRKNT